MKRIQKEDRIQSMTFQDKLDIIQEKNNSLLCLGLDPQTKNIPPFLSIKEFPQFEFNKGIINATYHLVSAYKPNSAFYESQGASGIIQLKMTCDYIQKNYPEIPIILDAKRGDIASSNQEYVSYAYEYLGVDAITLQPYLGKESLEPFLHKKEKGCFILCRTSNEGAKELQDLTISDVPLYQVIAKKVVAEWNTFENCYLVIGATYPEELAAIRLMADGMTFLVPGVGAQQAVLEKTVKGGLNDKKKGLIISASRSVIFASAGEDYCERAREEAEKLRTEINNYRL